MNGKDATGIHGNYADVEVLKTGSNRSFGLFVGGIFATIAVMNFISKSHNPTLALILGLLGFGLMLAGALFPSQLSGLNRKWMELGQLLGRITTPIVLGAIFYFFVTPLGILMRICGARPLNLEYDASARTYWKDRPDGKFKPETMKRQF